MMHRSCNAASAVIVAAVVLAPGGCAQEKPRHASFDTPEKAATALIGAVEGGDAEELRMLLGPGTDALLSSGDPVADRATRESFVRKYRARHRFVAGGPDDLALQVGEDQWPLPIPLVRHEGRWQFDGAAGAQELLLRRIGGNELHTIDVMRGFVVAQQEYAATGHDGAPAGVYAQRLRSEPGKHNGLYWKVASGEPPSPAGPLLAAAAAEGYASAEGTRSPYHGYVYRMLLSQGPAARGGGRDYLADGRLTGGFALLASPAAYAASGVMTFMVNQDGVVWQRDLGEGTAELVASMRQFNPDDTWTPIAVEE